MISESDQNNSSAAASWNSWLITKNLSRTINTHITQSLSVLEHHAYIDASKTVIVCHNYKVADVLNTSFLPLREFLAAVASEKARATNMNCEVVAMVKHDKSEPLVDVTYC